MDPARPHRIDVHHHLYPPGYLARLVARKIAPPPALDWRPETSIADMDRAGVATAIVSITAPGLAPVDADFRRAVARECNEFAARMMADHRGRFGSFATLPLPDIDTSLAEIAHALDVLGADGIGLLTSYGDRWLGDPVFAPVMDELNRRRAVVYVHPTAPECNRNLLPGVLDWVIEFPADTTRTIASLLFSGTIARCPDIAFIFAHCGGVLPFISDHLVRAAAIDARLAAAVPGGVRAALAGFHYDTALRAHPAALAATLQVLTAAQLLFGTDAPLRVSADQLQGLLDHGFSPAELHAIECGNAQRLLPRWRP